MVPVTGVEAADEGGGRTIASLYHTREERRSPEGMELMDGVSMGVLLEVEAGYAEQGDESESDVVLATFELGIDAELTEAVSGHVLLLWEEDDTEPIDLDEGYITLGETEAVPLFLKAGKMYVPFGSFHSHFISDPLTLELGETRESAVLVGYGNEWATLSVGAFNGDIEGDSEENHADDLVASLSVTPSDGVEFGVSWISDLGDSDVLQEGLLENVQTNGYSDVAALGAYLHVEVAKVVLDIEYIGAIEDFSPGQLGAAAAKPSTWNVELAVTPFDALELAAKSEGSDDFPDQPELQYGLAASYGLTENMTLAAEYLRGEFDEMPDRDMLTAQMAMEF